MLRVRIALIVLLLSALPVAALQQDTLTPSDRLFGLSLLWKEAAYNFPYFDQLPQLDWDTAYRSAIPRVLDAPTTFEYYRELQRFAALLEDGHTRVSFPDSIVARRPFSSPWVDLRAVSGRALVSNVAGELLDSLPVGSEILRVDGLRVSEHVETRSLPYVFASAPHSALISAIEGSHTRGYGLLVGPADTRVDVGIRTSSGEERTLTLRRDRFSTDRGWVHPSSPPRPPVLELEWPESGIALLSLNSFSNPTLIAALDSVLPDLREADGVVVDLRENTGGSDVIGVDVLARLTDRSQVGTGWRARTHDAYYRALGSFGRSTLEGAFPDDPELVETALRHWRGDAWREEEPDTARPTFEGEPLRAPIAFLIDRTTASAAENFLVRLPETHRFVTIGTPTAASTGQPLVFSLPGGGAGQVVTRAVLLPDGTPLVKRGIVPDIVVEPTVGEVRAGADPALRRALEWLRGEARRLGASF